MSVLNGVRVLVTRPVEQAEALCRLITEQGGIAVRFPTLAVVATEQLADIQKSLTELDYDWWIFVSVNAVNFALQANNGKIIKGKTHHFAAIGQATRHALEMAGLTVDLTPDEPFDSEALLALSEMQVMTGQRVLIVRGVGGREILANTLRQRGAVVDYLNVYQRIVPKTDDGELIALLAENKLHLLTATSGEVLQNLLVMVDKVYHQALFDLPLIVVSDRIRQLAVEMGFKRIAISSPSNEAILKTIISMITGEECG